MKTLLALFMCAALSGVADSQKEPMGSPNCVLEIRPICWSGQIPLCVCFDYYGQNCTYICVKIGD